MPQFLKHRIQVARKEIPADLVLKQAKIVNLFSGSIRKNDIAICGEWIAGVGPGYQGRTEIDLEGRWIVPGLIDAHIHIESSMLTPFNLAKALLPHGTTTLIADPHEIANVMGLAGIDFMLQNSQDIPFDIFFTAPSCVPATHLETSGARLTAHDLNRLKNEPRILGLAEMMNYPGVLSGDEEVLNKIELFKDRILDGHAPLLSGPDLQAYAAAGIRSDHETQNLKEGLEKLESGMLIMIREGTGAKNLHALLPLIKPKNARRFCFVVDDLHPVTLRKQGHLDHVLREAIKLGLNPVIALQLASLNAAEYFGLKDRGAIAPGLRADLVVLNDLARFSVEHVIKNGKVVVTHGELVNFPAEQSSPLNMPTFHMAPLALTDFVIRAQNRPARIIELIPDQIATKLRMEKVKSSDGLVAADTDADILKLAVVERHHATGNIGLGLVKGFGLKKGAIASSIAHDSHNIIVVGVEDQDLFLAVETIRKMNGGLAVTAKGSVLAQTPLPIAGLMTQVPLEELVNQLAATEQAIFSLDCKVRHPIMQLAFLALPVIPELKLTDKGLVDVTRFEMVPLFEKE
jgi:adenine deaminase